jgi:hypothetical protein
VGENFLIADETLTICLPFKTVSLMIDGQAVLMSELGIKLPFAHKPVDLCDFGCGTPQRVFVHMRRQLTQAEFDRFANRLTADTSWLIGTAVSIPIIGAHACVMVTAPQRPILFVDTQGYSYARYVARLA